MSDAEIAELKRSNIEFLRADKEYNERRDAENAKLRAENVEFRDRLTKVEQKQTLNDNTSNNNPSNFNSDTSLSRELIPEILPVSSKSSKETKIDIFLDEVQKKKVSDEIRQRNRKKKLLCESSTKDLSVSKRFVSSVDKKS